MDIGQTCGLRGRDFTGDELGGAFAACPESRQADEPAPERLRREMAEALEGN